MFLQCSQKTIRQNEKKIQPIYLIYQFFIHKHTQRRKEIQDVLKKNIDNPLIHSIFLLNEKIYTEQELGITHEKIKQIDIGRRLLVSDIFNFIEKENLNGYIITCNADIFFNNTLQKYIYKWN